MEFVFIYCTFEKKKIIESMLGNCVFICSDCMIMMKKKEANSLQKLQISTMI